MVALNATTNEFEKCIAEKNISKDDADFEMPTAVEDALTAAEDSGESSGSATGETSSHPFQKTSSQSSSQSSGGATGESSLGARPATVPDRAQRKVSFQADEDVEEFLFQVDEDVEDHCGASRLNLAVSHDAGATSIDADLKVFCVYCGQQVPSAILKAGTSFCTYCGQRHPENLMNWASGSQKTPTLNEERSRLHGDVNWLAKRAQTCAAEATPTANSNGQGEMPQVRWNHGQGLHAVAHLGHQAFRGQQGRLQHQVHNQRHHGAKIQNSQPAYVDFPQPAF